MDGWIQQVLNGIRGIWEDMYFFHVEDGVYSISKSAKGPCDSCSFCIIRRGESVGFSVFCVLFCVPDTPSSNGLVSSMQKGDRRISCYDKGLILCHNGKPYSICLVLFCHTPSIRSVYDISACPSSRSIKHSDEPSLLQDTWFEIVQWAKRKVDCLGQS